VDLIHFVVAGEGVEHEVEAAAHGHFFLAGAGVAPGAAPIAGADEEGGDIILTGADIAFAPDRAAGVFAWAITQEIEGAQRGMLGGDGGEHGQWDAGFAQGEIVFWIAGEINQQHAAVGEEVLQLLLGGWAEAWIFSERPIEERHEAEIILFQIDGQDTDLLDRGFLADAFG